MEPNSNRVVLLLGPPILQLEWMICMSPKPCRGALKEMQQIANEMKAAWMDEKSAFCDPEVFEQGAWAVDPRFRDHVGTLGPAARFIRPIGMVWPTGEWESNIVPGFRCR